MMDHYFNLTKALQTAKEDANKGANIFIEYWMPNSGKRYTVFTENEPHFISKLVAALHEELDFKPAPGTEYHRHVKEQGEPFNATLISRHRNVLAEYQNVWDTFMLSLTHA